MNVSCIIWKVDHVDVWIIAHETLDLNQPAQFAKIDTSNEFCSILLEDGNTLTPRWDVKFLVLELLRNNQLKAGVNVGWQAYFVRQW